MSIVQLVVLGALKRRGVAHGYRIHRDLVEWRVETWTIIRPGSIYHALAQMEKQKLIKPAQSTHNESLGPSKVEYAITEEGQRVFVELLQQALKGIDIVELSVGIAFMEYLDRQKVVDLLTERAAAERQVTSFLQTLPVEDAPSTPSKHPELIRVWSDAYTNAASSTDKLIHAIQSGKYIFKNEETEK